MIRIVQRESNVPKEHTASILRMNTSRQLARVLLGSFIPKYGDDMFLQNVGLSPNCTAL
jgi:hypothetical protein